MDDYPDAQLVEALRRACPCTIKLDDGRALRVLDVAWGYDMGDDHAHITTNVSPGDPGAEIDFFFTCEIEDVSDSGSRVLTEELHPKGTCSRCF